MNRDLQGWPESEEERKLLRFVCEDFTQWRLKNPLVTNHEQLEARFIQIAQLYRLTDTDELLHCYATKWPSP